MSDFKALKLDADLLEHLHSLGYREPTDLQLEAVPVISRGTNAVGVAGSGSGKTLAYALGLAARVGADDPALQALVMRPTDATAAAAADTLVRLLRPRGLRIVSLQAGAVPEAQIVVASPASALAALERSALKLDGLGALVIDGLATMIELGEATALETLSPQVPKDAQRVVLTARVDPSVEDWLSRHAHRARRLMYLPPEPEPLTGTNLEYICAPHDLWLPSLIKVLRGALADPGGLVRVRCRFAQEAEELSDRVEVRGVPVAGRTDGAVVHIEVGDPEAAGPDDTSISWGAPADLTRFRARFQHPGRSIAFVEPRELAHLRALAGAVAVRLVAARTAFPDDASRSLAKTRERLRDAVRQRDLEPYLLLLEPLMEEFAPSELAAAATALLREHEPAEPAQPLPAWTRLYFGVGRRDGVRPADLVGAITGEASVTGDQIGRIEIRDTNSAVEIDASVADQVIKALAGATIRGRPTNVRVFRG